jgi:hypothetical protein
VTPSGSSTKAAALRATERGDAAQPVGFGERALSPAARCGRSRRSAGGVGGRIRTWSSRVRPAGHDRAQPVELSGGEVEQVVAEAEIAADASAWCAIKLAHRGWGSFAAGLAEVSRRRCGGS